MGEALDISRASILRLAQEAEVSQSHASQMIDSICVVARQFADIADRLYPGVITRDTVRLIRDRITENVDLLR